MARNILENVSVKLIYRLEVNFNIQDVNMDSLIGRTAHL